MSRTLPGDDNYIKLRAIEFCGKFISFSNFWCVVSTTLLYLKLIDNSQWLTILAFTLGGRTMIKSFHIQKGNSE